MTTQPRTKQGLAWSLPNLAGPQTLTLTSPDFDHGGAIPAVHAAHRVGGQDLSPALTWSAVPNATAQMLLAIEDPHAPTPTPFVHGLALLDPSVTGLPHGALNAGAAADGVRLLRSGIGSGYFGPAPPKSHGPHRYAFQLFALATPVTMARGVPETAKPRDVLAAAADVLARGRLDGTYRRS
jgi:Raf kinase inhibitor-like YbhB/YbcL family protein